MSPNSNLPMVRWFSPRELLRTGSAIAASSAVVRLLDRRTIARRQSDLTADPVVLGDWKKKPEVWIDYVADTGDGWNPTFTVARTLARESLSLVDPAQGVHEIRRGDILVLGGDQVYPTPRGDNYEKRLFAPFRAAIEKELASAPVVLAIPGNHDWYDGLAAFTRLFCYPENWFAAWETKQTRSYFAAQLPGDWWLLGIDIQFGAQLDKPQLEYFEQVEKKMSPKSRVVLCMPEPGWLDLRRSHRETTVEPAMQIEQILKRRADLCLAGDLHHYQRHETIPTKPGEERLGRICAGGGGGFLHATQAPLRRRLRGKLAPKKSFPPAEESKRYRWRLLAFPILNPSFGLIPALVYTAFALSALLKNEPIDSFGEFVQATWEYTPEIAGRLGFIALLLLLSGSLLAFHEWRSRLSRLLAAGHLAAHLALIVGLSIGATKLAFRWAPPQPGWAQMAAAIGLMAAGSWVFGSGLVGLYLWVSTLCNRFLHVAHAALRIEDWKCFLRLRVQRDGTLTIFPIGFQRVARRWARRTGDDGISRLEPDDPRATPPELIEMPIVIPPRKRSRAGS
jgi:hypothetical protein